MISQRMIAESLGMPTSTVANILNGTPYYKKETRERVLKKAEELGYQRNRASITIKRGRSNVIGVIHFGSAYETAHQATCFLIQTLNAYGYDYVVLDQRWHAGNAKRVLDEMIQARVEGVILIGNSSRQETFGPDSLAILERAKVPVVSLYGDDYLDVPTVTDSAESSFFSMARHLQRVGHRSIFLFSLPDSGRSQVGRVAGFQAAMKKWGPCHVMDECEFIDHWLKLCRGQGKSTLGVIVQLDMKRHNDNLFKANYQLSKDLFASQALPDAIMCVNDRAASGVFNAAYDMKVRVPEDVAVTGADNDFIGEFSMFRLTTVRMDINRASRTVVEMLVACLKGKTLQNREAQFPAELILRQSCGRAMKPGDDREVAVLTTPEVMISNSSSR